MLVFCFYAVLLRLKAAAGRFSQSKTLSAPSRLPLHSKKIRDFRRPATHSGVTIYYPTFGGHESAVYLHCGSRANALCAAGASAGIRGGGPGPEFRSPFRASRPAGRLPRNRAIRPPVPVRQEVGLLPQSQ